jgi:hypothetical protein
MHSKKYKPKFNGENVTKYLSPINQSIIIICLFYQKYYIQEMDRQKSTTIKEKDLSKRTNEKGIELYQ